MTRRRRLGVRGRLALAMGVVAVAAVGLATLLGNAGLQSELDKTSRDRLQASTRHLAEVAADLYAHQGRWTATSRSELRHLGEAQGLRVVLGDSTASGPLRRQQVVTVDGRRIGAITVSPVDVAAFQAPDRELHDRLNRLHLVAAGLAALIALMAALQMSGALARPLRRLTEGARRMEQGELGTRIEPEGAPEIEDVARALNRLSTTLEREDALRREATADLAHELRTPLTGILSRIEAAQDGVLPDATANLSAMHAEALRLRSLLDDLTRLAEAQSPGLLLEHQQVDLAGLARGRVDAFADRYAEKGIGLAGELGTAVVTGDPKRLEQVVDNLLSNALRYTDPGGRVVVRTAGRSGETTLEVSDTGIGIAAEELPQVFERFWRSDKSRSRSSGGAGIGLAIVRELVHAHDGRIDVESHPGEGTTFTVRLPAAGS